MKVGDKVEDFELPDQTGTKRTLSALLADGPVVLFFYPAAMTAGCTKQSCHFRDLAKEFEAVGAQRVGISSDPVAKQQEFADKHTFDYPLLSDVDQVVATQFGVVRGLSILKNKRVTFVIEPDRTIGAVIKSELRMNEHADRALEYLQSRQSR